MEILKRKLYGTTARIIALYRRHEQHLTSAAFVFGFIWDNLTLTRIDLLYDNAVLASYIVIATFSIFILYAHSTTHLRGKLFDTIAPWLPLAIQFAFGGLFSGFIIFYSRSATFAGSWPFLLFLALIIIGNEQFRTRYLRLTYQLSILFIALLSYTTFFVPVLFGKMGADIFIISGLASLALLGLVTYGLSNISRAPVLEARRFIVGSIAGIFVLFNIAYFTNVIPPIPLSLKEIGVYHHVERLAGGDYLLLFEPARWYDIFSDVSGTYHFREGEPAFVWSAVFAPTRLNTTILHRWSYYDETVGRWVLSHTVPFPIVGGRDGGYRGYSIKETMSPGKWRVDVITERRQLIGRTSFTAVYSTEPRNIKQETR